MRNLDLKAILIFIALGLVSAGFLLVGWMAYQIMSAEDYDYE